LKEGQWLEFSSKGKEQKDGKGGGRGWWHGGPSVLCCEVSRECPAVMQLGLRFHTNRRRKNICRK